MHLGDLAAGFGILLTGAGFWSVTDTVTGSFIDANFSRITFFLLSDVGTILSEPP
jgi:hypothetical protein